MPFVVIFLAALQSSGCDASVKSINLEPQAGGVIALRADAAANVAAVVARRVVDSANGDPFTESCGDDGIGLLNATSPMV